jgi:hypothetical protein
MHLPNPISLAIVATLLAGGIIWSLAFIQPEEEDQSGRDG